MKHNKTAVFWTAAIMAAVLFALLAMPWIQQTHGGALVERCLLYTSSNSWQARVRVSPRISSGKLV